MRKAVRSGMSRERRAVGWWLVIFLGFGAALALSLELLFETQDQIPRGLDPHRKNDLEAQTLKTLEHLKGRVGRFWVSQGRFPNSLDEMLEYRVIEGGETLDPFRHRIRWEEDASGSRLRSAGWDRVHGTRDDITLDIELK